MCLEWYMRKKPSVLGIVSGSVMGLVMITPGAGYVDQTGAFFIGLIGGVLGYFSIQLKHRLGFDDALDAFGVHGIGGIVGGLLTGLFANPDINGAAGAFYGNPMQFPLQIYGIVVVIAWSGVLSAIILKCIDLTIGLRVTEEEEDQGLDFSIHGERIPGVDGGGEVFAYPQAPIKVITVGNAPAANQSYAGFTQVAPSPT
ncbi:ammonium transporter family-domain-containing protein [Baffinella frigidus]|nr:ammonium transporter family-domain-containing protein [Cryptophyta sp. CCMP2293]